MQYWHAGQRHRESTCCERPREAKDILRNKLLELDRLSKTPVPAGNQLTVCDLYHSIERDYIINARKSLRDLKIRWNKHLQSAFAGLQAKRLTAEQIGAYIANRLEEKASNGTINRELAALKRMYKLAIKTGRLKFGQQPYFPMLKENNVRKGFVKDTQYADLARTTGEVGLWLRTLFELGFIYGWRKGELLGLRVSQVDMMERTIVLHAGETKNDQARMVEMTGAVYDLLAGLVTGKAPEDKVFTRPSKSGQRPIAGFRKAWATATKKAGCEGLLFHDLRRTGVRNLVRAGVTEKIAMKITGHKTRSVFDRYDISSRADIRDAIVKVERASAARRQRTLFEQGELALEDADAPRKPARSDHSSVILVAENVGRKPS
jgi:integrase